jgi:hypothetical protein
MFATRGGIVSNRFLHIVHFQREFGPQAVYDLIDDLNAMPAQAMVAKKWGMSSQRLSQIIRAFCDRPYIVREEVRQFLLSQNEAERAKIYRLEEKPG